MRDFIEIDGGIGEGGGQILRTSIVLSAITKTPLRIFNIRIKRRNPGLGIQHVKAVEAISKICSGKIGGVFKGSKEIWFEPGPIKGGNYVFDTGTAASATLIFQVLFLPLSLCKEKSTVRIIGGTHNPMAPPFEFLSKAYISLLNKIGFKGNLTISRMGFYPKGGGIIQGEIEPVDSLQRLELTEKGRLKKLKAISIISSLPKHIAEREINVSKKILGNITETEIIEEKKPIGPGNAFILIAECENITEVFTCIGKIGLRAEKVASTACREFKEWIKSKAAVCKYLTDQIILPMALLKGGTFTCLPPTSHTKTNIEIIKKFLDVNINIKNINGNTFECSIY